jgi:hypothetical protein
MTYQRPLHKNIRRRYCSSLYETSSSETSIEGGGGGGLMRLDQEGSKGCCVQGPSYESYETDMRPLCAIAPAAPP